MTRKFNAAETQQGFNGWIRNNPRLDSREVGLTVVDSDLWVHRFKSEASRDYQFLMLVEVKEFNASLSDSQRDTLHIVNQLLRNRKNTSTKFQRCDEPRIQKVKSIVSGKDVDVLCFGVHTLRIQGDGTFTHWQKLLWDNKNITSETLEGLLRFEIDPDTLGRLDHRPSSRHKTTVVEVQDKTELGFTTTRRVTSRS